MRMNIRICIFIVFGMLCCMNAYAQDAVPADGTMEDNGIDIHN